MKKNNLKILMVAAEITPIAKVGGLGDVIGALPKALADLGVDIRIIIPFYGSINKNKYKIKLIKNNISVNGQLINLHQTTLPETKIPVYLIEHIFFKDKIIYGSALNDSVSDIEKFSFFSQAVLPAMKAADFQPDIIHLNDWHTATLAKIIKTQCRDIKTVYTIHNLANQGLFSGGNLMADGILNSDIITTVSPTYAKEILTKEYGCGLEKILAKRKSRLYGILNGIDTDFFNPAADNLIKQKYSLKNLEKKTANKLSLQKQLKLPDNKNIALVGLVTRFVKQKGIELITENFSKSNCQFVFLGTGEKKYEIALLNLAKKFPKQFNAQIKFDEKLAHQIYASSDIFLVPSRFEPCGLTQMIAMRYGASPLVRLTGGLADTVNKKNGFTFKKFSSDEFYKALKQALKIYYEKPKAWQRLTITDMKENFSWNKSAREYLKLYKKLIK